MRGKNNESFSKETLFNLDKLCLFKLIKFTLSEMLK